MGVDLGGIEFYAGPPVLGGPDDLNAVIREFIDGATSRLLVAVQELDSRLIAESILAQLRRLNSEFANYVPAEYQLPRVRLAALGDPEYFPLGVKHRYTRKPAG